MEQLNYLVLRIFFKIFLLFFLLIGNSHASTDSYYDSLKSLVKSSDSIELNLPDYSLKDTSLVNKLLFLAKYCLSIRDYPNLLNYTSRANRIATKLKFTRARGDAYMLLGIYNFSVGSFNIALQHYDTSLVIFRQVGYKPGISGNYSNISSTHRSLGNYPQALKTALIALKINEEIGDKHGIASNYSNLANICSEFDNKKDALNYYFKANRIYESINSLEGIGLNYNNIGVTYEKLGQFQFALYYLTKAIDIQQRIGAIGDLAYTYNSIGTVYLKLGDYKAALNNYTKGLNSFIENNENEGIAFSYSDMGSLLLKQKKYTESAAYFKRALNLSLQMGAKEYIVSSYKGLAQLDSLHGDWKSAYQNHQLYILYRDSIQNEENAKKLVQSQMQYDFDKKQTADSIKVSAEKKVLGARIEQQKTQRNAFIAGFGIVLILSGYIFRSYKQKQKANLLLEEKNVAIMGQKEVIEEQKKILEVKQKQIISSINYAKHIQQSILVPEHEIKKQLPNSFVLYLPKDIVSGDFYWFRKEANDCIIACADCTGHGVPGAFLSMVGSTLLNEIVGHKKILDPSRIIKELAKGVASTLSNRTEGMNDTDGMDISICRLSGDKVYFAAANNSLYIVNQKGLREIEPQVNSINGIFQMNTEVSIDSLAISDAKGSMLYLSTDGYADQPGEVTKRKLFSTGFEKLLLEIHALDEEEQKGKLETFFYEWKGKLKQHDDILVIGIRV